MYLGSLTNRVPTHLLILQLVESKNVITGAQEVVSKYAVLNAMKVKNSRRKCLNSMLGRQKLNKHRIQALFVGISSLCLNQLGKL